MSEILFTTAAVVELLSEIEELSDRVISVTESSGSDLQIVIGQSTYNISSRNAVDCEVDVDTIEEIKDVSDSAYDTLSQKEDIVVEDIVEGGLITGLVKSLFLGGIIRAIPKLLK